MFGVQYQCYETGKVQIYRINLEQTFLFIYFKFRIITIKLYKMEIILK